MPSSSVSAPPGLQASRAHGTRFFIATCRAWPQGNAGLQALAAELPATLAPWQDISAAALPPNAAVLPLAAWDYSETPDAYRHWLHALQAAGAHVINPVALQIWNMDKRYLCELAAAGLPVTPSLPLLAQHASGWAQQIARCGWHRPVIKPLIGQSGRGVRRLDEGDIPTLHDYPQGALLQAFVPAAFGEVCLIYLAGRFSHAARRCLAAGEWRANSAYGARIEPVTPHPYWLDCAQAALRQLPARPLYARIDGLIDSQQRFCINEVELIEPALYPHLRPAFAHDLSAALINAISPA